MKLVRMRPLNKNRGINRERHHTENQLWEVSRGWYEVEDAKAARLATERYDQSDPDSPLIFEVKDPEPAPAAEPAAETTGEDTAKLAEGAPARRRGRGTE